MVRRRRNAAGIGLVVISLLLITAVVPHAHAHPADTYYLIHTVNLSPEGVQIDWVISPGPMLAFLVWNEADLDGDGLVDPAEARTWAKPILSDYLLLVDGEQQAAWQLDDVTWPSDVVEFEVGAETIVVHISRPWPEGINATPQLALYSRYQELNSVNWFYINGLQETQFHTPHQQNGALVLDVALPGAEISTASAEADPLRDYWDSGVPALLAGGDPVEAPKTTERGSSSALTRLLRRDDLSLPFYLTAFAIALGLGAIHALTPGHGKALVGAYLVGSRGTMKHAVVLGSIVTLTHTGSVLALGVITLAASHILMPTTVFPILEAVSGLLVVAMGGSLLYRRWRAWRTVQAARERRALLEQTRSEIAPTAQAATTGGTQRIATNQPIEVNVYNNVLPQDRDFSVGEPTEKTHRIAINQPIKVNVYNDVLPQERDFSVGSINWRSLITLGISGGLVPCPDAIAILLVAVAINRVVLGLSLIMAFSLGLAGILTGIGIAMVRSQRLLSRFNTVDRLMPAMPVLSAVIVTGLGLVLTYNALARPGLLSGAVDNEDNLVLTVGDENETTDLEGVRESGEFDLKRASVLYMETNESNLYQLWVIDATGGDPIALTEEPYGVWDYRISPDGTRVVYSTPREYGGSDIWQIGVDGRNREHVLACETAACTRPIWSPDGARLVHERMDIPQGATLLEITTLWWYELETGTSGPVFRDSQLPSYNPTWSPDGKWLSYISPGNSNVQIHNLVTNESVAIPSQTGSAAVWSPDSDAVLVTDVWTPGENDQYYTHVMRYDLESGTLIDLTGPERMGDTWVAWSPDGKWIATVRREYTGPNAALGDQVWVMRPDGSDARKLTTTADVIHGQPVWSPDSQYLLFQRYVLAGSEAEAGIFVLDVSGGEPVMVSGEGNWPAWLP